MYTIVGGGLAGTFLAARLLQAGSRVSLYEGELTGAATRIAAGLINVITGRLGAKTWLADTLLHDLWAFFATPPFDALRPLIHEVPVYRPFSDIAEYNKWTGRTGDPEYAPYADFQAEPVRADLLRNPLGGIWIQQCGWVDANALMHAMQATLVTHFGMELRHETYAATPDAHTILCSGWRVSAHFPNITPNKGDILRVYAPEWKLDFPISRKIYIIPQENDEYIVGATYEPSNNISEEEIYPSEAAKAEICEYLEAIIAKPYRVIAHHTGVRPTTSNFKPVLGRIISAESQTETNVFSGFGTKGLLYSAYMSQLMADFLLHDKALPKELLPTRFKPKAAL